MPQVPEHEPAGGGDAARGVEYRGRSQGGASRVLNAEVLDRAARDLQHLDLEHHFGLGDIDRCHEPLRHAHRLRRVADHHRVRALVHEQRLGREHRLQHVLDVLRRGVGQVERAHDLLLVVLLLGGDVGIDEHRVVGEDLTRQRILIEHQFDGVLDRHVLHEDAGLAVALHVLVENEVDARFPLQHLEHHLGRRIAQLQGDLAVAVRFQVRRHRDRHARIADDHGERLGRHVAGVFIEDSQHLGLGRIVVPVLEILARRVQRSAVALVALDAIEPLARAAVDRVERQHAPVQCAGRVGLIGAARAVGFADEGLDRRLARGGVVHPETHVVRVAHDGLTEIRDPGFVVAAAHRREPLAMQVGGASGNEREDKQRAERMAPRVFHLSVPVSCSCCCWLSGL